MAWLDRAEKKNTVPAFLAERELERGVRPNRPVEDFERTIAEQTEKRAWVELDHPLLVAAVWLGSVAFIGWTFGHLFGWW